VATQTSRGAGGRQQPCPPAPNVQLRGWDSHQLGGDGANLAVAAAGPLFVLFPGCKALPAHFCSREAQLQRGERRAARCQPCSQPSFGGRTAHPPPCQALKPIQASHSSALHFPADPPLAAARSAASAPSPGTILCQCPRLPRCVHGASLESSGSPRALTASTWHWLLPRRKATFTQRLEERSGPVLLRPAPAGHLSYRSPVGAGWCWDSHAQFSWSCGKMPGGWGGSGKGRGCPGVPRWVAPPWGASCCSLRSSGDNRPRRP